MWRWGGVGCRVGAQRQRGWCRKSGGVSGQQRRLRWDNNGGCGGTTTAVSNIMAAVVARDGPQAV
ncbi:hypothetical protein BGW80DRAFT_1329800 [Lactifluus volemus]|nr:hypothetical protein BGW80DRAFT_1329800 [Lactifluus volemus]